MLDSNLSRQLCTARIMYQEARDEFEHISRGYQSEVGSWSLQPRKPMQVSSPAKKWVSVYHRQQKQVPTVRALLISWAQEKMVAAGTSASVAYEKAKMQWRLRRQGADPEATAFALKTAGSASSDVDQIAKPNTEKRQSQVYEGT